MKPVMGYPSQTAAIRALKAQGMGRSEIAQMLGMKATNVDARATEAVKHGPSSFSYDKRQRVYLGTRTIEALKPYADVRGITPTKLVQMLIDTVLHDAMIDAVLDDREPVA